MEVETVDRKTKDLKKDAMLLLEEALVLCKFGKFHLKLLVGAFFALWASMTITTTSSFILPIAECDLNMNIIEKGWLNAIPFFGLIASNLFVGFFVDTFGRRLFLVGGNIGLFLLTLLEGSSQTYAMLVTIKLLQGVAVSVVYTPITVMLSEFVYKDIRNKIIMIYGTFMPIAIIFLVLVSWAILPQQQLHFVIWDGYFELRSWNIYLYVCSTWSLISALIFYLLPESPKFLLSEGQNEQALEIIKKVYSENTGYDKNSFPIKTFESKTKETKVKISIKKQIVNSLIETKHLFDKKTVGRLILISVIMFLCLCVYASLRMWFPQLSTVIENYKKDNGHYAQFCEMIDSGIHKHTNTSTDTKMEDQICIPNLSGTETYINALIMGFISLFFVAISGFLIDRMGHKLLMSIVLILSAAASAALYFSNSSLNSAILMSSTCAFAQIGGNILINISTRVFPTKLRALSFSIITIIGRFGSVLGNVLFPILLNSGCMFPFYSFAGASLCLTGLVYFLPDPNEESKGCDE